MGNQLLALLNSLSLPLLFNIIILVSRCFSWVQNYFNIARYFVLTQINYDRSLFPKDTKVHGTGIDVDIVDSKGPKFNFSDVNLKILPLENEVYKTLIESNFKHRI